MQYNVSFNRSKVASLSDVEPVPPVGLRTLLRKQAVWKALRAFKRHGEKSYQFWKASRSRWLRAYAAGGMFHAAERF